MFKERQRCTRTKPYHWKGGINFKKFPHRQNIKLCEHRLSFSGLKVNLAQNSSATLSRCRRHHNNSLVGAWHRFRPFFLIRTTEPWCLIQISKPIEALFCDFFLKKIVSMADLCLCFFYMYELITHDCLCKVYYTVLISNHMKCVSCLKWYHKINISWKIALLFY